MTLPPPATLHELIPQPAVVKPLDGTFTLPPESRITVSAGNDEAAAVGEYLAGRLRPATGYPLPVLAGGSSAGEIHLAIVAEDAALGDEGYQLSIAGEGVRLAANRPAGLFRGAQTLRQLLPPAIECAAVQHGPWLLPAVEIRDIPRFAWRGAMLDVARHFFPVEDVRRFIDALAYYKINTLHLHLSDDQGWRIEIQSWPELTQIGGQTQVGKGPGGFYTQEQFREIVRYAQSRFITIVPEIDVPGHTNAALVSYPELTCSGEAPQPYRGVRVGFSSLCIEKEITYRFMDDVIRELAALTPGPYIHLGGDEARSTRLPDYVQFMTRVQEMVLSRGKIMVGWDEMGHAPLHGSTIIQHWNIQKGRTHGLKKAVQQGAKMILSPANRVYLDMKYNLLTKLGQIWAGMTGVRDAYDWEPCDLLDGVPESALLGIEAPLWSETIRKIEDIEYLVFPRLPGVAELAWSPRGSRDWETYRERLAAHGPRLSAMGINFYRSSEVPWRPGSETE